MQNNSFRPYTVCFTGHRYIPESERVEIAVRLRRVIIELIEKGYKYFGAGGALGFDTLAAKTVLDLRREYPHIKLILVLPCKDQCAKWSAEDVRIYESIRAEADKSVWISENYTPTCMHERNRRLVDFSSVCVCYLTQNRSGTAYTVNYARECGVKVMNVWR